VKRIITYLMCALFLTVSVGSVHAVEKREKKTTTKKVVTKKKAPAKATQAKKTTKVQKSKKKYDNFIDKNKNGIVPVRKRRLTRKRRSRPVVFVLSL